MMLHPVGHEDSVQESINDELTDVSPWIPDTCNVSDDDLTR